MFNYQFNASLQMKFGKLMSFLTPLSLKLMPRMQVKERNRVVLRNTCLLLIQNTKIEASDQMEMPWSQRALKSLKFVALTTEAYTIPGVQL